MSYEITKSDFTVINGTCDWQPRPAITEAMHRLRCVLSDAYPGAEFSDTWVSFDNIIGHTTIFATPIDITTPDGYHLRDRLVVKTVLPEDTWRMSESLVVEANTLAATGALMIDPNTDELVIVSSMTFIDDEGQDEWLRGVYVPLIGWAAVCHPYGLVSSESLRQSGAGAHLPYELEMSNEPSLWGQEDFEAAEMILRQAGIFSNAGSTGLAAEFPWDDGGVSWVTDDETSLLTFESEKRHPNIGNGLYFKLELPDAYSEHQLVELVHHLNRLEVTGADVPPFFGAWCSHIKTGRIAYVGFLPNLAYWPGSVSHMSAWLKIRAQTARATIGNYLVHVDQSRQMHQSILSV